MKKLWGLKIFIVFLFCIITHNVFSKENKDLLQSLSRKDGGANTLYIENKGQIGDQDGKPNLSVKYLILRPGLNIQLKANSFSYDAYTIERFKRVERLEEPLPHKIDKQNDDSLVYHFSRVDIELVDANPNPQITHEGASSDYLNYYTHITSQTKGEDGATGVRGYSTITYHDIYPSIDLEWFLDKDGKAEYQFIINPGGDPSRIRLKYHGAKKTELISDAIHIHIKPGIIKEHIPLSYLKESKEKLQIAFTKISNDEYGFNIPTYASNETLVIDPMPNRLWGTYYGGDYFEIGLPIATDASRNVYLGGATNSTTDIASTGAYDVTKSESYDAFLVKFSSTGSRIWGTYYGGNESDQGRAIATDASGNVYLGGNTASTTDITSTGAYKVTFEHTSSDIISDAFLVKFSSTGSRVWGTYYGGSGMDYGNAIATDASGNVYLGGTTRSFTNIASAGGYKVTFVDDTVIYSNSDAFLVKFSSTGSRIWGTYYGGSGPDIGDAIATDASGNVYLGGATNSTTDIASTGAYDITKDESGDAFLVKFSSTGSRIWGTYYGGNEDDEGRAISTDASGNVYLGGNTASTTDIASTGAYDVTLGGTLDAFLVKFSSTGSRFWGTYYGGSGYDSGNAIATDATGNVYLGAYTKSTTDIASNGAYDDTPPAYDSTLGEVASDAFLVKFSSTGSRIWGTYYGGSGSDHGSAIATDASGNVYLGGTTYSTTDIASNGSYDDTAPTYNSTFGGFPSEAFIAKFDDSSSQTVQTITLSVNSLQFCEQGKPSVSYTAIGTYNSPNTFTVQLSNASGSFANPIVIGTLNSLTSGIIQCQIPPNLPLGTGYRIRVVSSNPVIIGNDNGSNISINELPLPIITGAQSACISQTPIVYSVQQVPGNTYLWKSIQKGVVIGSSTSNSINIRWTMSGIDTLRVSIKNTLTGCARDTFLIVSVVNAIKPNIASFGNQNILCKGDSRGLECLTDAQSYQWKRNGKIIEGATDKIYLAFEAGEYTIHIKSGICEGESEILKLIEYDNPKPLILGEKNVVAGSDELEYRVSAQGVKSTFWSVSNNAIIKGNPLSDKINIQFPEPGKVKVSAKQESEFGCTGEDSIIILVTSMTDVKEARSSSFEFFISPNPTGESDQFLVRFAEKQHQDISIELLDILGSVHYTNTLQAGSESCTIPVQGLSSGMYVIRLRINNEVFVEKVIVN